MRSLFDKETLDALQQQVKVFEDCFNNPNLEDEAEAHLQELANSRGKTLDEVKEVIAAYSQRLQSLAQLEVQHEQLMQRETASEDEALLGLEIYAVRFKIHVLLKDLLDNYWDFFPVNYSKNIFRQLAYRISEVFSLWTEKLRQIEPIPQNSNLLTSLEDFTDVVQKSLDSALEAIQKVGALAQAEVESLKPENLAPDTTVKSENEIAFQPKSPLGKKLWERRKQILAAGIPSLSKDEIEKEIAERRGGVVN